MKLPIHSAYEALNRGAAYRLIHAVVVYRYRTQESLREGTSQQGLQHSVGAHDRRCGAHPDYETICVGHLNDRIQGPR